MTEGKEIAIKESALPTSLEEVKGMAEAFFKSGMFSDVKQVAQAIVKIQAGRELGLPPVYSMQNINLIRDRLTTSANTMAMLVKRSGKYNYRIKEHTDLVCTITFTEEGKIVGESSFSIDDAKRANLVKPDSGWAKFPRAMLFSRAISQGARIYAPDAIGGIYTDEEIRSIPTKPNDVVVEIVEPSEEKSTPKTEPTPPPATPPVPQKPVETTGGSNPSTTAQDKLPEDRLITPSEENQVKVLLATHQMDTKALGDWLRKHNIPVPTTLKQLPKSTYDKIMLGFKES